MRETVGAAASLFLIVSIVSIGACGSGTDSSNGGAQAGGGETAGATGGGGPGGAQAGGGGATGGATGGGEGGAVSRCTASATEVACPYEQQTVPGQGGAPRSVLWQVPLGAPPAQGSPVVLLFQGSFVGPHLMFEGSSSDPFGRYFMALTVKELLDAGYAVLAPAAHAGGSTYWDTNVPPWSFNWAAAPDNAFMLSIFAAIAGGDFGSLDASRMYAAGISSGGYMTSRMAVSYPGKFRALAVHSASYATCSGSQCAVPDPLPSDHPPTLFLHGGADQVAPVIRMEPYHARLVAEGKDTKKVVDPNAGHAWLSVGPGEVLAWFAAHP